MAERTGRHDAVRYRQAGHPGGRERRMESGRPESRESEDSRARPEARLTRVSGWAIRGWTLFPL